MFDFLMEKCKNCGENHFLYKTDFKCDSCKKELCKSCSGEHFYLKNNGKRLTDCKECYNKTAVAIRKMIAVESSIIKEYEIIKESNFVAYSDLLSISNSAIENLKLQALRNNFDAIINLKTEIIYCDRRKIIDLQNRTSTGTQPAYIASGILVNIKKQP